MSITFTGNEIPETPRILTGFHSLDRALSNKDKLGYPLNTMTEVYGRSGVGKTTWMMSIGGLLASKLGGKIAFADLEGQSKDTIINALTMHGFVGEVDTLLRPDTETHSDILDTMIEEFAEDACNVAMLDSVGAFMSPGELEGSVNDANMGKRPFIIGNWTRKIVNILSQPESQKVCMYVTHQHSNIGFVGTHTSGGETKNFLNSIQIELQKKDDYEAGWLLEGRVRKLRHGQTGRYFRTFIIGGHGAHRGLSAVFDCIVQGLASEERKVIRMDGVSYGKVSRMIETADDESQFNPFFNALQAGDVPAAEDEEVIEEKPKKRGRPKKNVK